MIGYNDDKKEVIEIITKFCHIIVNFFIRKNIFPEEQREIYQYGFELWVSSAIGILVVLAIGIISGRFWESIIFYIVFCFTRLFSGGFHAPTYLLCKLTFASVLILALALDWLLCDIVDYYWYVLYLYSSIIICRCAPVENSNKKLTEHEKLRSKVICIVEMMICPFVMLMLNNLNSELYHIVALTLFSVANLMLLGIFYERRKK
ncbi:MAG: accessory gene regulator B family protein [Ruminococcus flavefaciens]|nr:accessory gene regulator B family protein [Ruminococcus flavefaciens]